MNEDIMRAAGLGKMVDLVKEGICPTCGIKSAALTINEDVESKEEFKISGMCQTCQDSVFNNQEERR